MTFSGTVERKSLSNRYQNNHVVTLLLTSPLRAIMRYHSLKMQEINKIIKELWIKTYRGGGWSEFWFKKCDFRQCTLHMMALYICIRSHSDIRHRYHYIQASGRVGLELTSHMQQSLLHLWYKSEPHPPQECRYTTHWKVMYELLIIVRYARYCRSSHIIIMAFEKWFVFEIILCMLLQTLTQLRFAQMMSWRSRGQSEQGGSTTTGLVPGQSPPLSSCSYPYQSNCYVPCRNKNENLLE